MNTLLATQQSALLDILQLSTANLIAHYTDSKPEKGHFLFKNSASELRGLRAYRANAQVQSESALHAVYPILQQLLGAENFRNLAQDFWRDAPLERGDLAQWGGALAVYLSHVPQLQGLLKTHPYLPDVVHVEWALHRAATASDAVLDMPSFQRLASNDPAELRLCLSPGCALLRSAYPVVAIMQRHDVRMSNVHDAARVTIESAGVQNALVWRQGFRTILGSVNAAPMALIEATLQGQSLAVALDAACIQAPDFDFSAWLAISVQTGLLMGVTADALT